jgi:hypothetical protein
MAYIWAIPCQFDHEMGKNLVFSNKENLEKLLLEIHVGGVCMNPNKKIDSEI